MGGGVSGNSTPNVCGAPLPQMRLLLVPMEVETEKKNYSELNNALRLVNRQDLRAGLYPSSYRIA